MLKVGVLALQGCVKPHQGHLEALGASFVEVRYAEQLREINGLILPGGESSTMLRLLEILDLEKPLRELFALKTIPVWGICAGAILMACQVQDPVQKSFRVLPMKVQRNAYGSQIQSFQTSLEGYPVCFIRAPRILSVEPSVEVKFVYEGAPVWVQQGLFMATTFHPELTLQEPSPFHRFFIQSIQNRSTHSRKEEVSLC